MIDFDSIAGSTLTPEEAVSPRVTTKAVNTRQLNINGKNVDGISDDPESTNPSNIPSSHALNAGIQSIKNIVRNIESKVEGYRYTSVISDPIISPNFVDDRWINQNFLFDAGHAIFINRNIPQNPVLGFLRIPSDVFLATGAYFLEVNIEQITSGKIDVVNEEGQLITTLDVAGTHQFEISVNNPSVTQFEFQVKNVALDGVVSFDSIFVYHVKNAMDKYMTYMTGKISSGGSGFASVTYVNTKVADGIQQANTYANNIVGTVRDSLIIHTEDKNNPHGITPQVIGAATATHGHSPASIGAADKVHLHTPDQVGSAPIGHTHDLSGLNAAPAVHTHTTSQIEDISDVTNLINTNNQDSIDRDVTLQTNIDTVNTNLASHTSNLDNPHSVTKSQIGLDLVENYPPATDNEAIDGILTNRNVNPRGNRLSIQNILAQPGYEVSKLLPAPIASITNINSKISIPIYADRIYQISISSNDAETLKNLSLYFDTLSASPIYRNNLCMGQTVLTGNDDIGDPINTNLLGWFNYKHPYFRLIPVEAGITTLNGELCLNTNSFALTGIFDGTIITDGIETIDKSFPMIYTGAIELASKIDILNALTYLNFDLIDPGIVIENVNIKIFELIQITQEPSLVVDATPVGVSTYMEGNIPPLGWGKRDGSELSRTSYPEIYNHAVVQGLIIDELTWQDQLANNGYVNYFSSGDNATTFRLPKSADSEFTDTRIPIIKIKYIQVPNTDELFYRFIWS